MTFLTPAEAARLLRVSEDTVRGMLNAGTLPGLRLGRLWRIPEAALEDWARLAVGVPSVAEVRHVRERDRDEQEAGGGCRGKRIRVLTSGARCA